MMRRMFVAGNNNFSGRLKAGIPCRLVSSWVVGAFLAFSIAPLPVGNAALAEPSRVPVAGTLLLAGGGLMMDGVRTSANAGLGSGAAGLPWSREWAKPVGVLTLSVSSTVGFGAGLANPAALPSGWPGSPHGVQEFVPVPEPATIFGALGLLGLAGLRERHRLHGLMTRRPATT